MSHTRAKIIADTLGNGGARITTFEVHCPRFLLAEINTHRIISKSAASSRAIPVAKRIAMVATEPYVPASFGKNRAGMQANEIIGTDETARANRSWATAIEKAVFSAQSLAELGVHKQHANRVLEPYAYVDVVLTATEWDNFFTLRTHADAQPEFQELALLMKDVYARSVPRTLMWHLPYTDDITNNATIGDLFYVSAARCARVSYKAFDGRTTSLEEDIELCRKLISGGHMSPFDHPARSDFVHLDDAGKRHWNDPVSHRQYWGWIPYRVGVEKERGMVGRRCSFAPLPVVNHTNA